MKFLNFLKLSPLFAEAEKKRDPLSLENFKMDMVRLYNQLAIQRGQIEEITSRIGELEARFSKHVLGHR